MEISSFLSGLEDKIKDVWWISESEYPFTPVQLPEILSEDIRTSIASENKVPADSVKVVDPAFFLEKAGKGVQAGDQVLVANLQKLKELYNYLQASLAGFSVYRIETGVQIPMYIVGRLSDGNIAGVKTISVES